ncbi:hypothetical protein [Nocardia sp. AB354]
MPSAQHPLGMARQQTGDHASTAENPLAADLAATLLNADPR